MTPLHENELKQVAPGTADPSPIREPAGSETAVARFPIVGIGASSGGLAAFEAFFSGLPDNVEPDMAFVLVQHLAPDHESILAELIRKRTRMPVFEVQDGMVVERNSVYIISPNHDLALMGGRLHLLPPEGPRGQRLPIDFFFRSLAQDQRELAVGIVLSGNGRDGTEGLRAIKAEGGMAMAQTPASAQFDGMPRSALATGLVDMELPPAAMAGRLIDYTGRTRTGREQAAADPDAHENAIRKICILLRTETGHDFSLYKSSTVQRRIERRMAVQGIGHVDDYARFLRQTPAEAAALFRDLLIGVTHFFRDRDAFKAVEAIAIPRLFAGKGPNDTVRVWTAGCSTGEEAYSLAMLIREHLDQHDLECKVQLFATDIDPRAIATARAGIYPASIRSDLTSEQLERYFTTESDGSYRIQKRIRDMLIFSEQDVIRDPPFSRVDMVTCRNLLIYLSSELQKRLIPLFHFALNSGGMLFLGGSESIGDFENLFVPLDRKSKLYLKESVVAQAVPVAGQPMSRAPISRLPTYVPSPDRAASRTKPVTLREVTEQALLNHLSPAAALVNAKGDIQYLQGRTGLYLEPASGEPGVSNLHRMAREGLREIAMSALQRAVTTGAVVRRTGLQTGASGQEHHFDLVVSPLARSDDSTIAAQLFLVVFEPVAAPTRTGLAPALEDVALGASASDAATISDLREALAAKEEYLQTTHQALEATNEALQSSNEELHSVNEELQSTNEELETSKEELQSVNEELATVNAELQTKVADLSRANNDMNNLLAGTGIGTIFVDHELRILRFTPEATRIINLIAADIGRPVSHIVSNLSGYDRLLVDVQSVLDTLVPKEIDVCTVEGKWYAMRIQPYRTLNNVIEGAVLTFVDISESMRSRDELKRAQELASLAMVIRDTRDAITVHDLSGRIIGWNPAATRLYGWTEQEALSMHITDLLPDALREGAVDASTRLSTANALSGQASQRRTKQGTVINVWLTATALLDTHGETYAIAQVERPDNSLQPLSDGPTGAVKHRE